MYNIKQIKHIVLNLALVLVFHFSFAQQKKLAHYKSDLDFGNGTVISTFLDVNASQNHFTITSPKNGDARIVGGAKAKLGRLLGKLPKKGTIVVIKGVLQADSLFGDTKIPVFGKLKFKGTVHNETLSGKLFGVDGKPVGSLNGKISDEKRMTYGELYPKVLKTIQDNIYSKEALQTREWKKFEKKIKKSFNDAHDDIELFIGFSIHAQKLPFTHLSFLIAKGEPDADVAADNKGMADAYSSVVFEEKNVATAYLQIKNFSSSESELAEVLPKIVENKAFKNLIIDLRDNGGGGISAAFELAKYIVTEDLEVGYFPTNKFHYSDYQPELFATLPEFQPKSTEDFGNRLRTSPGVKLIFKKPSNPVFTGKIYILTNGNTASTCEPIVYALKNHKKATIIGEKTYGGMLSASPFVISGKYMLMLPVGDFYTYDGVRLDKVGVKPDIEVKSKDALSKALEMINK